MPDYRITTTNISNFINEGYKKMPLVYFALYGMTVGEVSFLLIGME